MISCQELEKFINENKDYLISLIKKGEKDDLEHGVSITVEKGKLKLEEECVGTECMIEDLPSTAKVVASFHTHPKTYDAGFERKPETVFSFNDLLHSLGQNEKVACVGRLMEQDTGDPEIDDVLVPLITCSCLYPEKFREELRIKKGAMIGSDEITAWLVDSFTDKKHWWEAQ